MWKMKEHFSKDIAEYQNSVKCISQMLARILMNRNIKAEDAEKILHNPLHGIVNPATIYGAMEVAEHLANFIKRDHVRFFVYADYDVDGLTSGYIMGDYLRKYHTTEVKYPERSDGYGLSLAWSQELVERHAEHKDETWVVITVDNGITKHEETKYLMDHGIRVLITDHHEPIAGEPPALAVCDPKLTYNPQDPSFDLCGAAVAWNICAIVDDILKDDEAGERIRSYLPYAAVATVSDVMPMTPSNAAFVNAGLSEINDKKQDSISALMTATEIPFPLTAKKIGWEIGPRLNACGRMGNTALGGRLFTEADKQKIAFAIDRLNADRKAEQKRALKIAADSYDEKRHPLICIVVLPQDISGGIAGGVAGQLADKYHVPAIVLNDVGSGRLAGSARSYGSIDLMPFFEKAKENNSLLSYGGHAQAAGVEIEAKNLAKFQETMDFWMTTVPCGDRIETEEDVMIDGELTFEFVTREAYDEINRIPYDRDTMPEPVFIFRNVTVESIRSSKNNENNIQLTLVDVRGNRRKFWVWGKGEEYKKLGSPKAIDLIASIDECGFGFDKGKIILSNINFRKAEAAEEFEVA